MKLKTKFQDENFKLGEVVDANYYGAGRIRVNVFAHGTFYDYYYNSIKDFTDHWEDVPEVLKEYWYVRCDGSVLKATTDEDDYNEKHISGHVSIGNYFETKEEADKAAQKLRAWKKIKDKGLRFVGWCDSVSDINPDMALFKLDEDAWGADTCEDLDLLFGGEE